MFDVCIYVYVYMSSHHMCRGQRTAWNVLLVSHLVGDRVFCSLYHSI